MWNERAKRLHEAAHAKLPATSAHVALAVEHYYPHDFAEALDGLADDLVDVNSYLDAATHGVDAVHDSHKATRSPKTQPKNVADVWVAHVRKYANDVPGRIAAGIADAANEAVAQEESADAIMARIDAKIEAFRSQVTRYAEPPWGTGNQGYGEELGANDVLLVWMLDDGVDDHCDDCPALAEGSPYERGQIPTWPKLGDTQCMDNCYCWITADEASWANAFPEAA